MNTYTNEINSDSSEQKYVHLSNGLTQSFEICYTVRAWIRSGHRGFILWVRNTCLLFGGGLQLCFAIFLYLKECVVILKFGSTVPYGLTREKRITRHKPIAWHTCLYNYWTAWNVPPLMVTLSPDGPLLVKMKCSMGE